MARRRRRSQRAFQPFNISLRNLTYRLRKFKDILNEELETVLMQHSEIIVAMVKVAQLHRDGKTGNDVEIASYAPYSPVTIKKKIRKGQPYDRVTLLDTGRFYESLSLDASPDGFRIVSGDPKSIDLIEKYGPDILKLSNENLKILLYEFIRPELARRLKERILE